MLVVEQSLEERIDVVIEDYVVDLGQRYADVRRRRARACTVKNCRTTLPGYASAWAASDTSRSAT